VRPLPARRATDRLSVPTPFDSFASEKDLAELIASWPTERLVATFNSLPGVAPVKSFKSA
jgi:hypothetical protein